jgi:predicted NUDIX family NTP pyrophosphohydrolase
LCARWEFFFPPFFLSGFLCHPFRWQHTERETKLWSISFVVVLTGQDKRTATTKGEKRGSGQKTTTTTNGHKKQSGGKKKKTFVQKGQTTNELGGTRKKDRDIDVVVPRSRTCLSPPLKKKKTDETDRVGYPE